jgi:hypothetical protein
VARSHSPQLPFEAKRGSGGGGEVAARSGTANKAALSRRTQIFLGRYENNVILSDRIPGFAEDILGSQLEEYDV